MLKLKVFGDQRALGIAIGTSALIHLVVLAIVCSVAMTNGYGKPTNEVVVNLEQHETEHNVDREIIRPRETKTIEFPETIQPVQISQPKVIEAPQPNFDHQVELNDGDLGLDNADLALGPVSIVIAQPVIEIPTGDLDGEREGADIEMIHFRRVSARVKNHLTYPQGAREEGIEGKVYLSMTLHADGSVSDIKVSRSSGYEILDDEALIIIERATPLPRFGPKLIQLRGQKLGFKMTLNFTLTTTTE